MAKSPSKHHPGKASAQGLKTEPVRRSELSVGARPAVRLAAVTPSVLLQMLHSVLRPVVRFCVRRGISIQELTAAAKELYVEEGRRELAGQGEKVNVSRLSALSGLQRRDVMQLLEAQPKEGATGLLSRVLGHWQLRYRTPAGRPRTLKSEEFRQLVQSISQDLNPGTVIKELTRVGAIQRIEIGFKLLSGAYVPPKRDVGAAFQFVESDGDDLIGAIEENTLGKLEIPNLHGRTEFDNIDPKAIPEIRRWLLREGSEFHKRVRDYLGQFDLDIVDQEQGKKLTGRTVSLSAFSRVRDTSRRGEV